MVPKLIDSLTLVFPDGCADSSFLGLAGPQVTRQKVVSLSSKELDFFNPRSQLNSTVVTYCSMQLKIGEDR